MDEDGEFRISIAGAQDKTGLLHWRGRWHIPLGSTPTTHILKPQIGRIESGVELSHSVENEYLCLKLTAALGLPTAEVHIHGFSGCTALVVTRFDRLWTGDNRLLRIPQEDCCQALSVPPSRKYEADGGPGIPDIIDLLKGADQPVEDIGIFLKSLIVFWLLGATDGHAKNFSIVLMPGGRYRLAPLYDVMSAQPYVDAGQIRRNRMKLAMAVGDNRHYVVDRIVQRHFFKPAERSGIGSGLLRSIFEDLVVTALPALDRVLGALPPGFPTAMADSIAAGFRGRLKLCERLGAD